MVIAKDSKRVMITIQKDLYDKIMQQAEKDNRSFSNYVVTLLKKELEPNEDTE